MALACALTEQQVITLHDEKCVHDSPTPQELWASLRIHFRSNTPREFVTLLGNFSEICPEVLNSLRHTESSVAAKAMEPVVQCLRMLRSCGYPYSDIEVIVAYASIYLQDCLDKLGSDGKSNMQPQELSLIICILLFLAHSYTEDICCPLKIWHKHVFVAHCQLRTLNTAVFHLMEQRGFVMRVDCDALEARLRFLRALPDLSVSNKEDE
jgi:hypothetical protein